MGFPLSQPQMLALLETLHPAGADRPTAVRGRFQTFQRYGLPRGSRVGRGRSVRYGPGELLQLLLAFELLEVGLAPERIAKLVTTSPGLPFITIYDSVADTGEPTVTIVQPRALSGSTLAENGGLQFRLRGHIPDDMALSDPRATSFVIINVTEILRSAAVALKEQVGLSEADFLSELKKWGEQNFGSWNDGVDQEA